MGVSRRTATWIAGGLLARLLMLAVLLMFVRFILAIHTDQTYNTDSYKLQSHTYAIASAVMGVAVGLLQMPVSVYLLCKSKRMQPSTMILDISMAADIVTSIVLASGVGAGFGATNDVLRYVRQSNFDEDPSAKQDLIGYYGRGVGAVVFLLVGMLLSICATVVSARLRARAISDSEGV